ncbi:MAG: hypothetical protein J6D10_08560, partial [Clostridia bacterium]|nr:hypothetical protein [Clostridia bacterium]
MYIIYTVALMVVGLFANVGTTASICWAIHLAIHYDEYSGGAFVFLWPAVCAAVGIAVRYTTTHKAGGRVSYRNSDRRTHSRPQENECTTAVFLIMDGKMDCPADR